MSGKSASSGLSVLIPIYGQDIRSLVKSLLRQLQEQSFPYEVLCYDDASPHAIQQVNASVSEFSFLKYVDMPDNLGRSKIRNKLAREAKYERLLFLDCDSAIVKDDFISSYWKRNSEEVVYGGTVYLKRPKERDLLLHYLVGKGREEKPAEKRQADSYRFMTFNNIMVSRQLMLAHPLDELILGYGHEDTLFGMEMHQAGVTVKHIDNPVEHLGLDKAEDYLRKSAEAARNLAHIFRKHGLGNQTGVVKSYCLLKKFNKVDTFLYLYDKMEEYVSKNLRSENPRLRLFDLMKLAVFCREMRRVNS